MLNEASSNPTAGDVRMSPQISSYSSDHSLSLPLKPVPSAKARSSTRPSRSSPSLSKCLKTAALSCSRVVGGGFAASGMAVRCGARSGCVSRAEGLATSNGVCSMRKLASSSSEQSRPSLEVSSTNAFHVASLMPTSGSQKHSEQSRRYSSSHSFSSPPKPVCSAKTRISSLNKYPSWSLSRMRKTLAFICSRLDVVSDTDRTEASGGSTAEACIAGAGVATSVAGINANDFSRPLVSSSLLALNISASSSSSHQQPLSESSFTMRENARSSRPDEVLHPSSRHRRPYSSSHSLSEPLKPV
mmetsp:Transcript_130350/g.236991  ORF Transcript_130350/g.236991 Transcript_130350/m.236991 type:complete len:301 (-) Transcript_130350:1001-1903(-)